MEQGDDGLLIEEVGDWAEEKHGLLLTYLSLHAAPRQSFIGPGKAGSAYIDVFSGPGRARIRGTTKYIDGSAVRAWKSSLEKGAPFTEVYIADADEEKRRACASRLRKLGAPVIEAEGDAL